MKKRSGTPQKRTIPFGREKGFTLVELLIVILVGTAVMGAVIGLLFMFITNFEINRDYTAARQRGEMVFSILAGPVLAAGLGMPSDADGFHDLFNGTLNGGFDNGTLKSWNGPLVESTDDSGNLSRDLYVAYGVPSGIGIVGEEEFSGGTSFNVELTGNPDLPGTLSSDLIDSWITFPSSGRAFYVSSASGNDLTLEPSFTGTIPYFDELHYVRAIHVTLEGDVFRAIELTRDSQLGEVDGILDMVFNYDSETRLLTAWVLARGDQRNPDIVTPDSTMSQWPGVVDLTEEEKDEMQHYRVSVLRTSWRVRN